MYDFDIDSYNVLCLFLPASSPTPTLPKKEDQSKGDLDWRPQYLSYPSGQENEELRAEVVSSSLLPVKEFDSQSLNHRK